MEEPQATAGARESGEPPCHINSNEVRVLLREIADYGHDNIKRLNELSDAELFHYVCAVLPRPYEGQPNGSPAEFCDTAINISQLSGRCKRAVNTALLVKNRKARMNAALVYENRDAHRVAIEAWSTCFQAWYLVKSRAKSYALSSKDDPEVEDIRNQFLRAAETSGRPSENGTGASSSSPAPISEEHERMMALWSFLAQCKQAPEQSSR